MFAESVDLMVCVAIVSLGENKDWIAHWMTCDSPRITVNMSFYMHSLRFRYLDWNQSWIRQTAEVYDIQIDANLKWLWHCRLMNFSPAYQHFLLKHSLSKLNSLIRAWTCLKVHSCAQTWYLSILKCDSRVVVHSSIWTLCIPKCAYGAHKAGYTLNHFDLGSHRNMYLHNACASTDMTLWTCT